MIQSLHTVEISHDPPKCKCALTKQLEVQGDRTSVGESTVWAVDLVNSHILLGVDAAVSGQLVSL